MLTECISKKKKIFIIDNNSAYAALADFLYKYGYEVEIVFSGKEVIQKINEDLKPELLLISIDFGGKTNGINTVNFILESVDIPVLFLAESYSAEIINRINKLNCYGFVLRDINSYNILSIIEVILKLHKAETKLNKGYYNFKKKFDMLAENAPVGVIICDLDGNIIYVNKKTLEILGSLSMEITREVNLLTFFLLKKYGFSQILADCMKNNKSVMHEMNYESFWGKKIWLRVHVTPLSNKEKLEGAQIIIDDITEEKQLEIERNLKIERLRMMLEGVPNPAWLISSEYRILDQNKAAEVLFELKIGDYCKKGVPFVFLLNLDDNFDIDKSLNIEADIGEIIWNIWWIPLGENVYLNFATDVTKYKKAERELYVLSVTDSLTNAYNRRYIMKELEQEILRSERTGENFSLIMLDLDFFKKINDKFGHNMGDSVLKKIVEVIKKRIRKTDTLARWGGEEFVVLLPDTSVENAGTLAENLRKCISNSNIPIVGKVTASFGVAGYKAGDSCDDIIQKADKMMYEAKSSGRNCVRF